MLPITTDELCLLIRNARERRYPKYDGTNRETIVRSFESDGDVYYAIFCPRPINTIVPGDREAKWAIYPGVYPIGWAYDPIMYVPHLDVSKPVIVQG